MADLLDDLSGDLFEDPVSTPVAAGRQVQVRKHSQMNISREAIMQAALEASLGGRQEERQVEPVPPGHKVERGSRLMMTQTHCQMYIRPRSWRGFCFMNDHACVKLAVISMIRGGETKTILCV